MNILRREVRHTLVQHVGMQPIIVELRDNICR